MLGDAETVVELHRLRDRIEAITARAAAAFDRAGAWADDGALTASAWLATLTRHPRSQCRRRLRLGRELATMPVVERAWLAGAISEAHVGALARARTPASAEAFAADEAELVAEAQRLRFSAFGRRLAYWRHRADAEGVNDEAERQHQGRRLHLSRSFEDTWFLDGVLDPVSGATRRAVEVRDRQCFHPFCETTVEGCQVDHVIPHAAGGPTTQDNGRLACPAHNRNRHRRKR